MSKKDLMSYEEYGQTDFPSPYLYHLEQSGQHLYFFGSHHTYDPEDIEITKLEECWSDFTKQTKENERIVLVEGGVRSISETKEVTIKEGGEVSYIAFLAKQNSINTESPEPPQSYWYDTLAEKFSRDTVAYYDFARICYQWNKQGKHISFEEYISSFLSSNAKESGWTDFDFSLIHMKAIHQELFQKEFNPEDEEFFYDIINPTTDFSIINKISLFDDEGVRDGYILKEVIRHWNTGKSLFIIFGQQHAVIMEGALRNLVSGE